MVHFRGVKIYWAVEVDLTDNAHLVPCQKTSAWVAELNMVHSGKRAVEV